MKYLALILLLTLISCTEEEGCNCQRILEGTSNGDSIYIIEDIFYIDCAYVPKEPCVYKGQYINITEIIICD